MASLLKRLVSNAVEWDCFISRFQERKKDLSTMAASSSSSSGGGSEFIHEGILFQILLRLPVSSLLRFKLVCKPWLSLIESPAFISQHTDRSNLEDNQENKLISLNDEYPFSCDMTISLIDLEMSNHLDFKLNTDDMVIEVKLIASFNGIICLAHDLYFNGRVVEDTIIQDKVQLVHCLQVVSLWNPATKHVKILPPPPSDIRLITIRGNYLIHYGFGFDNKTKDYRVVRVFLDLDLKEDNTFNSQAEVYSLNTDSWRVINVVVPLTIFIHSTSKRPFRKNDVFYWLGSEYTSNYPVNLSFDFTNEVFGTIPMDAVFGILPGPVDSTDTRILASLSERLACIHWVPDPSGSENFHCKIWMLDTCGVNESWTKLYTVILEPRVCPLGFSVNGKMVLKKKEYGSEAKLLLFDPARQEFNDTPFKGMFSEVAVYKESLVSVKGVNGETYSVNNKWKENSSTWDLRVSQMIRTSIKEFTEILDHDASALIMFDEPKSDVVPGSPAPTRWSPPLTGIIKLNTDAIWRSSNKQGTFGWVARNAAGIAVRAACSSPVPMLSDIAGAAEAIRSALYGARNAEWESIIIESGCKPLVSMITGSLAPDSWVSRIVDDIKDLCTRITSVSFSVLPMVQNTAAHSLARYGFSRDDPWNDPCTWDQDEMPDWLNDIIAQDLV